jgi:NitT/TauT family transport system ATP-binding protein
MAKVKIDGITKSFEDSDGEKFTVLDNVSLEAASGSFTSIMGPSGCGKSTLLNIIAGILEMDSGTIEIDELPHRQDQLFCPYVFQEPRLLDWATVAENIKLVLEAQNIPEADHADIIDEQLSKVGLEGEHNKYPQQLSGGMQQRVGIARALAVPSDLVLMDEPFSSLDEITAANLRTDLIDLWQETEKTVLFVTHDMREAIYLSDSLVFIGPEQGVFHEEDIDIPRPRDIDDSRLLNKEADLMRIMSKQVETGVQL